jgi:hypothetical protein
LSDQEQKTFAHCEIFSVWPGTDFTLYPTDVGRGRCILTLTSSFRRILSPSSWDRPTTRMILERRGYRCTSIRVVTDFAAGGSDDSVFPLASGTPPEIRYPRRSACPSRAFGWSSLTTPWGFPCFARFPCVHTAATTPAQRLNVSLRSFHPDVSVFPDRVVGST